MLDMKRVDTSACVYLCKWLNEKKEKEKKKKQGLSVPVTVHQGAAVSIFSRMKCSEEPLGGAGTLRPWGASARRRNGLCQLQVQLCPSSKKQMVFTSEPKHVL